MKTMKITICSSADFFDKLWKIKEGMEKLGHQVFLPSMKDFSNEVEDSNAKIKYDLIHDHFDKINQSDAIYIANYEKKGIPGYIGGNAFLEMGKAYDLGIPIFLMNSIPKEMSYYDELVALQPIVIGEDWDKLKNPNSN